MLLLWGKLKLEMRGHLTMKSIHCDTTCWRLAEIKGSASSDWT